MSYRRFLRLLVEPRDIERELDEEIETHIALRTEELIRRGVPPEEARAAAARRFGDQTARNALYATARAREGRLRPVAWAESLLTDAVLALRRMRSAPGVTALTVLTFSLGIGLTTAGFTVVDHVLIRSLPYPEPHRLVSLQMVDSVGNPIEQVSSDAWLDWRARGTALEESAIRLDRSPAVTGEDDA